MSVKRSPGSDSSEVEFVGSLQKDFRFSPRPFRLYPGGCTGLANATSTADKMSMWDSGNFGTVYPITKAAHLSGTSLPDDTFPTMGLTVFRDIDPMLNIDLSFLMGITAGTTANNLTATVRLWGLGQLNCASNEADLMGACLGEWALTAGTAVLPTGQTQIRECPTYTGATPANASDHIWNYADTIAATLDYSLSPGFRRVGGNGVDTICHAVIDQFSFRHLIIAVGQTAATPCDMVVPILRQL